MPQENARDPARGRLSEQERMDPLVDVRAAVRADRRKIQRVPIGPPELKEREPLRR